MPPGRPRSFDVDRALERAADVFWTRGFAATSLDDLCEAMGIARPSLYAAFGDKQALYLAALERFRAHMAGLYEQAIREHATVRERILGFLRAAIERYTSGHAARGCLAVCTATTDAAEEPRIREALAAILHELDDAFAASLRIARDRGELAATADVAMLGRMLSATQHTLAVRARAGSSKPELERIARGAVELIFDQRTSDVKRPTSKRRRRTR
jgi:TetR/AcrR family transcriptional regulator, copper-responsive repressor